MSWLWGEVQLHCRMLASVLVCLNVGSRLPALWLLVSGPLYFILFALPFRPSVYAYLFPMLANLSCVLRVVLSGSTCCGGTAGRHCDIPISMTPELCLVNAASWERYVPLMFHRIFSQPAECSRLNAVC